VEAAKAWVEWEDLKRLHVLLTQAEPLAKLALERGKYLREVGLFPALRGILRGATGPILMATSIPVRRDVEDKAVQAGGPGPEVMGPPPYSLITIESRAQGVSAGVPGSRDMTAAAVVGEASS
jgi:hypothetical protein